MAKYDLLIHLLISSSAATIKRLIRPGDFHKVMYALFGPRSITMSQTFPRKSWPSPTPQLSTVPHLIIASAYHASPRV
ncbi:uncharacterized protein K460DRAFT_39906 [Cucurbitaria berberidis CBS 394.84]|uniref:Uncharacterized protein n=1 Tax=Cucurbitaria berberidis CBS 394.84 TaxID=1168544 RepID=A0A9P4GTZ3_9PLEO|nr:uncharacterized protein K460DRAFT_39906 [Cucurbitaria berberidis CBS 394.84]KAF1851715.1 hypothetical protein K460DRAFT_39906 [Cucurbitaria berberidis CBS 394.84]